jgi:hypothetical protein
MTRSHYRPDVDGVGVSADSVKMQSIYIQYEIVLTLNAD